MGGRAAWWGAWGLIALLVVLPAGAVVSTVSIDAGVEYQSQAGGGIITFTNAYTPTSVSIADNFLYLGAPVIGYSTLGIDTPANTNMSVTAVGQWELDYSTTQTLGAKTERIYTPGRTEPTVAGAGSSIYASPLTSIVTSLNDNVILTWHDTPSYVFTSQALTMVSFLPVIMIIIALRSPEHWRFLVGSAVIITILMAAQQLLAGMGV